MWAQCETGLESTCVWVHDEKTYLLWKMKKGIFNLRKKDIARKVPDMYLFSQTTCLTLSSEWIAGLALRSALRTAAGGQFV